MTRNYLEGRGGGGGGGQNYWVCCDALFALFLLGALIHAYFGWVDNIKQIEKTTKTNKASRNVNSENVLVYFRDFSLLTS